MESVENFDVNTPINIHIDLVIKSYELKLFIELKDRQSFEI